MTTTKKRWIYFTFIIITIPLGIGSRSYSYALPWVISKYGGDVLAAVCIFWGVRWLLPKLNLLKITLISYIVCIAIETLQLYHAPWIEAVRHTPPFGLLLGYGFLWSDWICYAVGTLISLAIALLIERRPLATSDNFTLN